MQPVEVDAAINQYFEQYKTSWEQTRFIAYITASCQATKELKPQDLIKFSWEKDNTPLPSKEEQEQVKARMLADAQAYVSKLNQQQQ